MKRITFSVFVFVLIFGISVVLAGEKCGGAAKSATSEKAKISACCAKGAKACPAHAVSSEKAKEGHACPNIEGKSELQAFHKAMHPMHIALKDENYDQVREGLPDLIKATKALSNYKCEGYEKCSEACKKDFDNKKGGLIESAKNLKEACRGKDNEKVSEAFDVMHEAYITFANCCVHPEKTQQEKTKQEQITRDDAKKGI